VAIPSYEEFVEMACVEDGPVYSDAPSAYDTRQYAGHFLYKEEKPLDAQRVTQDEQAVMVARMSLYQNARRHTFGRWTFLAACPQCDSKLAEVVPPSLAYEIGRTMVRTCNNCGYWEMEEILKNDWTIEHPPVESTQCDEVSRSIHRRSVIKHFAVSGIDVPIRSLSKYILRNPDEIQHIHPNKMEELVGHVFRETMDCEVSHLGGPNDGGIDLLLIQSDKTFAIQVKRRASRSTAEPVSSIREFLGALILTQQRNGVFVTSAPRFSGPAKSAAKIAVELGSVDFLQLTDSSGVLNMLAGAGSKEMPWQHCQTTSDNLPDRVEKGDDLFLELAAGAADWRASSDSSLTRQGATRWMQLMGIDTHKIKRDNT
jgi:HJR/Mrr/RecB family endonuclease